ncbi:MAG: TetR/AcrR family transcriptional regulator [Clostridia bacterium]|nr:TetR/AcrR family transcriptional regulator [Clostridia bacterium]
MNTKPLDKINVSELCNESGINRATFYRHYELPRDVLRDIEQELIEDLHIRDLNARSMQEIERFSENLLTRLYERADILKILIRNRSDEEFSNVINELYVVMYRTIHSMQGGNDLDEDSAKLLSAYTVGGVYFLLRQWLISGINKSPKEVSKLIFRFLIKNP